MSWISDNIFPDSTTASSATNPPVFFKSYVGRYLNKTTVPSLGISPSISRLESVGYKQSRAWDVDPYRMANLGGGSAPTGHVICDIHRPAARAYGMLKLLQQGNDADFPLGFIDGPAPDLLSSIATFYGRVVMGSSSGKLYMSQLHKDSRNDYAGKCYQNNDPTDKDFNELLATDGTVVEIGGAGDIVGLVPFAGSLLVFATNGLWELRGSDNSYDIANIGISQIYNEGVRDDNSIVAFPSGVVFFTETGIISVTRDPTVGTIAAQSISDGTIKKLYEENYKGREVTAAVYDPDNARVEWFFGKDILQFDVRSGGFFRHRLSEEVNFALPMPDTFIDSLQEVVTVSGVAVTVSGEDVTVDNESVANSPDSGLLYYNIVSNDPASGGNNDYGTTTVTRSYLVDKSMYDLVDQEYEAFAVVGHDTFNDPSADKDIDRLFVWFEITEDGVTDTGGGYELDNPSSCLLSTRWEWATSDAANRWYNHGNIYKLPAYYVVDEGPPVVFDPGYEVTSNDVDLLGQGKSVLFRFDAEPGKHMSMWGWSVIASSEVNP